ncbi:hypothetical protein [Nocardia ninae]|uniref:Uncharacterized protein n=1 Tax=Nocardia ninae NBRC 108245 TaxID=1210091 RepID=A0A511MNY0_9NOCA|nr:hypothetical protein [Nocardia ninae]GEM42161.1 hypothetical protein NN4_66800 [Nocardia ninae NBRC 108245]
MEHYATDAGTVRVGQLYREVREGARTLRVESFTTPRTDWKGHTHCLVICVVADEEQGPQGSLAGRSLVDADRLTGPDFVRIDTEDGA